MPFLVMAPILVGQQSIPSSSQLAPTGAAQVALDRTATLTIDLPEALARAKKYGNQVQSANLAAALAHEDKVQARAATLPSVNAFNQFIYTEGNGTPSGVFVANDGVHVYNEQAIVHEELLSLVRRSEVRLAAATEAAARAKADVALRGLAATVIQNFYSIASAERKAKNARTSLGEAQQFVDISQKQEHGGEVAHSDVIKAQLSMQQRQRDVQDAQLAIEKAKLQLAVLIFPDFGQAFDIVDDLQKAALLPPLAEATTLSTTNNPDLTAAAASKEAAAFGVSVARHAYLPSFGLDFFYGINANQFTDQSGRTQATGRSTLPNYQVDHRQNLGYSAQATLNIPVWNWGSTHSKVKQAQYREKQAELDLTLTERQVHAGFTAAYREAQTAEAQLQSLKASADLAAESLRLTFLRYQAGESLALEVVDAQNTASLARGAYDDGLLRYRVALANLQTLTGTF